MTVGIILASHGDLAEGLKRSGELIIGEQEKVTTCILLPEESIEAYREKLIATIESFDTNDPLLFLVDLWGGTPFNQINQIIQESTKEIVMVAGMNLPMLIQAYNERFSAEKNIEDIVASIVPEAKEGVRVSTKAGKTLPTVNKKQKMNTKVNQTMNQLGLQHVRLDERLIHGQVATLWLGNLGANRVMIVDDDTVNDPIAKASLKTAVPGGVKLSILKTATAAKRLKEGVYEGQKIMLIAKNIQTIFDLIADGVPIKQLNIGNISAKEGAKQVTKSVFLTDAEISKILELEKSGITITAQMVPMEDEKPFSQFYRK